MVGRHLDQTDSANAKFVAKAILVDLLNAPDAVNSKALNSVIESLESWQRALRDGRTISPSVVGLTDMIRVLSALR